MDVLEEAAMLVRLARWGLALARYDTRAPSPVPDNPKFMTPRAAIELIRDGAVVAASGLGAHQRASILYWALREAFVTTRHPRRLTIVNVGGHGSRGLLPGTLDELAQPGLCTRFITSHFETFHGLLALAAAGKCALQCIPLGVLAQLYDAQGRGRNSVQATAGLGTFLDPRCRARHAGARQPRAARQRRRPAASLPHAVDRRGAVQRAGRRPARQRVREELRHRSATATRSRMPRRATGGRHRERRHARRRGVRPRLPAGQDGRCGGLLSGHRADGRRSFTTSRGRR